MVKHSRRRSHSVKRGGSGYTSASSYGEYVNGSGGSQFSRTFDQSGPYGGRVGSEYVGAQGQNASQPNTPTDSQINLIQSAGRRHKKRGGFPIGSIVNQAIVPFSLLGLQQTYRRKKHGGRKSRKNRTRSHRRR
uniref:Uncharacterized protein n=1 Tax=viral metagenome TaxID=1070528 RepID=A0A6C0ASB9_9ZZZZ